MVALLGCFGCRMRFSSLCFKVTKNENKTIEYWEMMEVSGNAMEVAKTDLSG